MYRYVASAAVLAMGVFLYIDSEQLFRAVIEYRAYREHIFTPPAASAGESRFHPLASDAQFYWDFAENRLERGWGAASELI